MGINFRATAGYVTDDTGDTYCTDTDSYPTTRGGETFGFTGTGSYTTVNRSTSYDVRLAGIAYSPNDGASQYEWRWDLAATGTYDIELAIGDASSSQGYQEVYVYDNTTSKISIVDTDGTSSANFDDATGTNYTAANWPGNETPSTQSFSTTTLFVYVGSTTSQSGSSTITHISATAAGGGATGKSNPLIGMMGGPLSGPIG